MSALPGLSALVRLRCSRENDSMNVFEQAHFERVEFCDDDASGLHAMNVIHSTRPRAAYVIESWERRPVHLDA